tara:strand:+ start:174 stop:536 length:363 start_codon:yes stop_codon:yes gene_type:complete
MSTQLSLFQKNAIYFFLGGAMLVTLNYLAVNVNSTAAALIWSFPVLSLPAYLIIYQETKKRELILTMNSEIVIFFFVNLSFFLFLYCLLKNTQISVYNSIFIALAMFLVIASTTYCLLRM